MLNYNGGADGGAGGEQTTRRFRVCTGCGGMFHTVRSVRQHQQASDHSDADVRHVTAEVCE